ncbi:hypothetical protein EDD18DRAFT_1109406 [Armillaria luteobubalina]|uniref:Uncharacterized protein n=1 Tax=Armillaria luteobubalina TaxID=153913 RepID=A0AA39PX34_9AGAR|nr:hypothetical protein EDD18DRAFT_1109406 [Armillaria luteobubalina]
MATVGKGRAAHPANGYRNELEQGLATDRCMVYSSSGMHYPMFARLVPHWMLQTQTALVSSIRIALHNYRTFGNQVAAGECHPPSLLSHYIDWKQAKRLGQLGEIAPVGKGYLKADDIDRNDPEYMALTFSPLFLLAQKESPTQ